MSDGVSCCIGPDGLHPCLRFLQHLHQLLFSGSFLGNVHVLPSLHETNTTQCVTSTHTQGNVHVLPSLHETKTTQCVTSTHTEGNVHVLPSLQDKHNTDVSHQCTHRGECAHTPISVRQTQHRCVTLTHTQRIVTLDPFWGMGMY